jgi:diaminopimelate epimerase
LSCSIFAETRSLSAPQRHEGWRIGGPGIGCDQVIQLELPRHPAAQVLMRIRNADGTEAEACGNATRCVADLLYRENGDERVRIETVAGLLEVNALADGSFAVDMGLARTACFERAISAQF